MDVRSPLYQAIARALLAILILDPLVATAGQLTVDQAAGGNTSLGAAGNGVPVVNIATPNGSGLSHNKFIDYNVDQQGLILNNSTNKTQSTQLGGIILGNSNLHGQAATRILNEVTGGSPSQLQGYTEVAGQGAHVIVANPNGITCDGCGFINTPRATLTTGKPILDGQRLQGYDVDGGEITIQGAGLNASNIDRFELITRSAKLNADLHANRLDVVAGRNQVDAETLAATAKADDGSSKPTLAIDSSSLGGMYAGAIRLVGTEAGVGVRLDGNMAASAGDIQIDANGQLSLAQTAASGNLQIKAQDAELTGPAYAGGSIGAQVAGTLGNRQSLAARQRLDLNAGQLDNSGVIEAGVEADNSRNAEGDLSIAGQSVRNSGSLVASRNLAVQASQKLDNQGGTLSAPQATLHADQVDNRGGRLLAGQQLDVKTTGLDNSDNGLLYSQGAVSVEAADTLNNRQGKAIGLYAVALQAGRLDNGDGLLASQQQLALNAGQLNNQGGEISAQSNQINSAEFDNRSGKLLGDSISVSGGTLDNRQGQLSANSTLELDAVALDNSNGGSLTSDGSLLLQAGRVENGEQGLIAAKGDLQANLGSLFQLGGQLLSQSHLLLQADELDNRSGGLIAANQGIDLGATQIQNQGGEISSIGAVALRADTLDNSAGKLIGDGGLDLSIQQLLNHDQGLIVGRDGLRLRGTHLDNSQGGVLSSQQALDLELGGVLDNHDQGALISAGELRIAVGSLDNTAGGEISSAGEQRVTTQGELNNQGGSLLTDTDLTLSSGTLVNGGGLLSAQGNIALSGAELDNSRGGRITAGAGLSLDNTRVDNSAQGRIEAVGPILGRVQNFDQHDRGELVSQNGIDLDFANGTLVNRDQGLIATPGSLLLRNLGSLDNGAGGEVSSDRAFTLASGELKNDGGRIVSADSLQLLVDRLLDNSLGGILSGGNRLQVGAGSLNNSSGGTLASQGNVDLAIGGQLDNQDRGLIASGQDLTLQSGDVDNQGGLITSSANLNLTGSSLDSSNGGEVSAQGDLRLTLDRLIQQQGRLIGESGLQLNLNQGALDNRGGLISTGAGQLAMLGLGTLDNRGGEISSNQSFSLQADSLDNRDQGRIISAGTLALDAASLRNANLGLLSGWQGLTVKGGQLDNSAGGTLSSKEGGISVGLSGQLDNHDQGALVSQGNQRVEAGSLSNAGQGFLSSQGDLSLQLAGDLDNSAGGLISAQGRLDAQGQTLNNRGGQIAASGVQLDATNLDNSGGRLSSQGAMRVGLLGALINSGQAQLASTGPLRIEAARVDNRGGTLIGQGLFSLLTGQLDNSAGGTLASQDALDLSVDGTLDNHQDGLILSQAGDLTLSAGRVDNRAGTLQSQGDATLTVGGALDNQGGRLVSQAGNLNIQANGGIDNGTGTLSAISGDTHIDTGSGDFDNQGGGLYASRLLSLSGRHFFNQGAMEGLGGKVGAEQIDFSLGGSLTNAFGLIESGSILDLFAATGIDNQNGSLRDLGQGGSTRIASNGNLDNRLGRVESANDNLDLSIAGLDNNGGSILHVGNGTFGLSTDNVMRAGGSLVTNGLLELRAASWTNSSVLQAGRLNLDIGQFTQTASGQLLAAQGLTGTGDNWINDGLLASDSSLSLNLSGSYGGNGRLTSLGDLSLTAAGIDLGSTASIAGGSSTDIAVGGTFSNSGRLTASGPLSVQAAVLNNYGTLGSGDGVRLQAGSLLNDHGLIFSGADMTLRGSDFTNRYGDVYSLGAIDFAGDDQGGLASRLDNLSGSIESTTDLSIRALTINNARDILTVNDDKYAAGIFQLHCSHSYGAADCAGPHQNGVWKIIERDRLEVTASSAMAQLLAGRDLLLNGGQLTNASSLISAGGNIQAALDSLDNHALELAETETKSIFISPRTGDISPWQDEARAFTDRYWLTGSQYDPNNTSGLKDGLNHFISTTLFENPDFRTSTQIAVGDQSYAAIIQAAGSVDLYVGQQINNSVIRPSYTYVAGGNRTGDTGTGSYVTTQVSLNQQLPPDLAQQQVNPISLPGFSLPSGSNGLFRLSGQGAAESTIPTPQSVDTSLTASGHQIDVGQPQQVVVSGGDQASGTALAALPSTVDGQVQGSSALDSPPLEVAHVQGVPSDTGPESSHKYLIETNPELTSLTQFLSSDYLLGKLGYDPDQMQKRLGDGLYEQRLIRQAVTARTGQRYIDGMTSDESLFKYLMDNAIAYKDELHLTPGVALSAEQVAALTHDIVWLEEAEVNGEKVLVPVLYLAQANNRLAPNGALIQGQDLNLISGGGLANQGVLRASNNLNVTASSIDNSGLLEANQRLQLLATDSIRNAMGGIIAGRDVGLTALTGDVLNQRNVTVLQSSVGNRSWQTGLADSAARIEAANSLSIEAGRDLANLGGVLHSDGDLSLIAGRDLNIASVQVNSGWADEKNTYSPSTRSRTTQLGAEVSAGSDLNIVAGHDLNAVASHLDAGGDLAVSAGNDLALASAANEDHSYLHIRSHHRKITAQEDHVHQQATTLNAGGNVSVSAGQDLALNSSKIGAGNEAYLVAGGKLELRSAQDYDYSLYEKKTKGLFGKRNFKRDEETQLTNLGSEITTGGDLSLLSGSDQTHQASLLSSGKGLALVSGGAVNFEGVKDLHQESHQKSKSNWGWQSAKGKGSTDESLVQSQLVAQGRLAIEAVDGLKIDIRQIDKKTVNQTIDVMVQANPQLAWLKDAEQRGDVDWQRVKEVHDSFKYSSSGLGIGAQLAIAIVVTALTYGVASAAIGSIAGAEVGSGAALAAGGTVTTAEGASVTVAAGWANVAATAVVTGAASNAAISTINNRGNLGAVFKDVVSPDSLEGYAISGVTAGLTAGVYDGLLKTTTVPGTGKVIVDLGTVEGVSRFAANQALQNTTSAALSKALGQEGSFGDALSSSLYNAFAAAGFNFVGYVGDKNELQPGSSPMVIMHALMGGLAAKASGGDFAAGAMAAGVNEAVVDDLNTQFAGMPKDKQDILLTMSSQLVGMLAAGVVSPGADASALDTGAWVAGNSTQYNYQAHWDEFAEKYDACKQNSSGVGCSTILQMAGASSQSLGNVAVNADASGNVVSYTLLDEAGKPWMIMEPAEYNAYVAMPIGTQEGFKYAPSWQLDLASSVLYAAKVDGQEALNHYGYMLSEPGYWGEMGLALALGGAGARIGGAKIGSSVVDDFFAGAKGTPAWENAVSKADGDFGYLPPVRQSYVKDVYDLQGVVDKMRASGASTEEVAKYAYAARNDLKIKYREYTPPDMLEVIDARNMERYGNKIGPAFDDLIKKGKTFDQIIESSTRAGGGDLF